MGTKIRACSFATLAILAPLWCLGCKESKPAPMLAQDLGTEGQPLVLPPSTFQNVNISGGQADWVPFREPGTEPEPAVQDTPVEDESADAAKHEESPTEIEIKTFITDYNALSDEGDFEELKTYIVESQGESITAAFAAAATLRKSIDALKEKVSEELGDQTDRIDATLAKIRASADMATGARLSVKSISVESQDEAKAMATTGSLTSTLKFSIIDDAWYLEFSELADAETLTEQLSSQVNSYDSVLAQLSDGSITAEQVLTNMEKALASEAEADQPHDEGNVDDDEHDEHAEHAEHETPDDDGEEEAADDHEGDE